MSEYKKVWKHCKGQWLRSHFNWMRSGDYFKVEGSEDILFATRDPYNDKLKGLSLQTVVVDKIPNEE